MAGVFFKEHQPTKGPRDVEWSGVTKISQYELTNEAFIIHVYLFSATGVI